MQRLWTLCEDSFPECERRSWKWHQCAMISEDRFHSCVVRDSETGTVVGLIFYWLYNTAVTGNNQSYCFVEHLAVDTAVRSAGYGSQILGALRTAVGEECVIFLEIESPVDEITIRREKFYLHNGYVLNSFYHLHPSFSEPAHVHQLMIMSNPRELTNAEFLEFRRYMFDRILKYSDLKQE